MRTSYTVFRQHLSQQTSRTSNIPHVSIILSDLYNALLISSYRKFKMTRNRVEKFGEVYSQHA